MKRFVQNFKKNLLNFLQIQCFLSLVSLPIIVAWGLPFSIMTAVGNFIFSPFITAFLLCASLIFFTELFRIPNGFLIILLEWITQSWLYVLSFGSKTWLISLPETLIPFLCIIALCAFLALQHKKLSSPLYYIGFSTLLIFAIALINKQTKKMKHTDVICNKKRLSLINNNGKLHLIDQGALGERHNPSSWISYSLLPEISKKFGFTHIDELTYSDNKKTTQKAIDALCKEIIVKKITKK